ncbi:type IV-A pilus assembly ATPase PilB [Candidatus Caldatribacterium sp.]|uniref:type IV-A pilus assembly ATPase PilB n=1 Tax=Candidatus Caldatribacterium sp. TaxID=2282143 RepID=UPI00299C4422|nr:type IV-A pilus assembly ATPase PilB [Candidatus Caldatribacterium sp.]MDW8081701.1 type IV-A pilus assembly ATPase PilB [Candidatus Calescibacterium sp.]
MEERMERPAKLGELLVKKQRITPEQLEKALEIQKKTGEKLGEILQKMGLVGSREVYEVLAEQLGTLYVDLDSYVIDPKVVALLPEKFCRQYQVIPVGEEGNTLILAMANPVDVMTIDRIRLMTKREIRPVVASPQDIEKALNAYYGVGETVEELIREAETKEGIVLPEEEEELRIDQLKALGEEAPIIRVVNMIILQAIRSGASDIHIEPQENEVRIRFRIDGILHDITSTPIRVHPAIVSRVKILSRMNIAERRLPQDGRFQVTVDNRTVDFRVSSLPTIFGEKIVMRILDKSTLLLDLDRLGFEEEDLEKFYRLIQHPYGMILLTGPTGSGKTTTLYSALNFINKPDLNIITIEDPVEYRLPGINQVQVRPKIGLTFANALRAIMRQDPDVIMVGEIRDSETAEIAIHAALTGHLVFSTLHTNTAAGALVRLQEMGVPSYLIASALIGVVAQRLVRRICERCKVDFEIFGPIARELTGGEKDRLTVFRGKGCPECNRTGYRGRTAVSEVLVMDDEMRALVLRNATEREITERACAKGMRTLRENAIRKVLQGVTTLEEMYRVTARV